MKFAADVNIAQKVIKLLRQNGHDVLDVKKLDPQTSDMNIIKLASKQDLRSKYSALVTFNHSNIYS